MFRRLPHFGKIAELQMHIVEQISYKTLRCNWRVSVVDKVSVGAAELESFSDSWRAFRLKSRAARLQTG